MPTTFPFSAASGQPTVAGATAREVENLTNVIGPA
jgi:hypothetical protein